MDPFFYINELHLLKLKKKIKLLICTETKYCLHSTGYFGYAMHIKTVDYFKDKKHRLGCCMVL